MEEYESDIIRRDMLVGWAYCQQCSIWCPAQEAMSLDVLQSMVPDVQRDSDLLLRHRERWLVGWVCYLMAITQYLIIGLVTSRDRALDVLSEFDRAVAERRKELIEEFKLQGNLPADFNTKAPSTSGASGETAASPKSAPSADSPQKPIPEAGLSMKNP